MDGARTRGHASALDAVAGMLRGGVPHAVLISGPNGVGKTTLAMDLAAGLLCTAEDPSARPCRACRGCRMVEGGGHPDLHFLRPDGAGAQIVIGDPLKPERRGVRDLLRELALAPLEGGATVAIIEHADRMNDPAQGALLKTLEEPPAGATIILCTDEEGRLADTIRSRCARLRLGLVGPRDIEAILVDLGVADAPTAARLGRLVGGRPGLAVAYARAPEARQIRGELARTFIDLLDAGPATRLAAMRASVAPSAALVAALDAGIDPPNPAATGGTKGPVRARGRGATTAPPSTQTAKAAADPTDDDATDQGAVEPDDEVAPAKTAVGQRRRGAEALLGIWISVTRDLAFAQAGSTRAVHDQDLVDEIEAAARALEPGAAVAALQRLERGASLLAGNVSPELVLDSLVLAWPRRRTAA